MKFEHKFGGKLARSRVRLRILKLLAESQPLPASEIVVKLGTNYVSARTHLDALEKGSVLTHANFGKRIRCSARGILVLQKSYS
jgi:predicted ArsR family transcriptional regulator